MSQQENNSSEKQKSVERITGKFIKEIQTDSNTDIGYYDFFIRPEKKHITVIGIFKNRDMRANYILEGDYKDDKTFRLKKIQQYTETEEEAIHVLANHVSGLTEKSAKKIVDKIGADIFGFAKKHDDLKDILLSIKGLRKTQAEAASRFLQNGVKEEELVYFLSSMDVPYDGICAYISHGGTMEMVKKNPFILFRYGVSFPICDRIAMSAGHEPWSFERLNALIYHALDGMKQSGNTRTEYNRTIKRICSYVNHRGKSMVHVPEELIELSIHSNNAVKLCQDGIDTYIADKTLFDMEKDIVLNLKRLKNSAKTCNTDFSTVIEDVERFSHITYNNEQKSAFKLLSTGGVAILLGGPGTGKTTTINGIVRAYRNVHPEGKILLCAPTGRAASRMAEVSSFPAMTIHKSMGLKWYNRDIKPDPLPYDLIIADEMSMCDTELLSAFLSAITSGTTLLLTGDYDQLPSVGPGQVLRDLTESDFLPVFHLKDTIRQKAGSTIIKNAISIRNGESLINGPDFIINTVQNDDEILSIVQKEGVREDTQFMVPIKGGKAGCNAVNGILQKKVTGKGKSVIIDGITFYESDRIIMNHNNYPSGYMNGDVGMLTEINDGQLTLKFRDKMLNLPVHECDGMTLSYALTVHKSQGAECDRVHILLPEDSGVMASRELLYTAVTRAKREVVITTVPGMLDKFLGATKRSLRECSLKALIKKS